MQNIKAIIFDFGGVILNIDFNQVNKAFTALGIDDFEKMYSQKNAALFFQQLEEGKLDEEEFYNTVRKSTNLQSTNQQLQAAWNSMLLSFRKEALDTLKKIRHKYKLYLLSNTNIIHLRAFNKIYKEEIGKGSLGDYFDKIYYSHEIGYRKPGTEAYAYVLKENGLSPSEALFIDDTIQNIDAAKALGLQTIFLKEGMGIEELNL
ncbi:MAG: HAD-superfamily hydrolase, subfamily variant 3 [Chitinophagaceae bacterium]|nr:HAD-superfamily hydrolase, subfamily variant 3 [Chitinophagaceae bacterium]